MRNFRTFVWSLSRIHWILALAILAFLFSYIGLAAHSFRQSF